MSDYLDGELTPASLSRMAHHLGECAECRRLLAGLRQTLHALHHLAAPGPGVDALQITASVRARLRAHD